MFSNFILGYFGAKNREVGGAKNSIYSAHRNQV